MLKHNKGTNLFECADFQSIFKAENSFKKYTTDINKDRGAQNTFKCTMCGKGCNRAGEKVNNQEQELSEYSQQGPRCDFLAKGTCNFFHSGVGVQQRRRSKGAGQEFQRPEGGWQESQGRQGGRQEVREVSMGSQERQ